MTSLVVWWTGMNISEESLQRKEAGYPKHCYLPNYTSQIPENRNLYIQCREKLISHFHALHCF
jgi:hypothetical protein